ncbi:MAG: hypothetical protein CMM52_04320 [Rhodospirillaceae bacterium]|nr:hypothetical protein [Rhodospirillaceae bacterium]
MTAPAIVVADDFWLIATLSGLYAVAIVGITLSLYYLIARILAGNTYYFARCFIALLLGNILFLKIAHSSLVFGNSDIRVSACVLISALGLIVSAQKILLGKPTDSLETKPKRLEKWWNFLPTFSEHLDAIKLLALGPLVFVITILTLKSIATDIASRINLFPSDFMNSFVDSPLLNSFLIGFSGSGGRLHRFIINLRMEIQFFSETDRLHLFSAYFINGSNSVFSFRRMD